MSERWRRARRAMVESHASPPQLIQSSRPPGPSIADGRVELWAPDLIYPDAASALRKLVQLEALASSPAEGAVKHLTDLPITVAATAALMPDAWGTRTYLTPHDGCYVALGAELVTAEHKLARELRKRGKRTRFLGAL